MSLARTFRPQGEQSAGPQCAIAIGPVTGGGDWRNDAPSHALIAACPDVTRGATTQNDLVSDASRHRKDSDSANGDGITADRFRQLAEARLQDHGIVGSVAVEPTQTAGLSLVSVEIDSGPTIMYESADWAAGVRVLDPEGEDLTVSAALDYLVLRVEGHKPSTALQQAIAPRHRA